MSVEICRMIGRRYFQRNMGLTWNFVQTLVLLDAVVTGTALYFVDPIAALLSLFALGDVCC